MNSRIVVNTSGIRKLRKWGVRALPALVVLLRNDELTFDTFVRCYSAAEQILEDADPNIRVPWSGGVEFKPTEDRLYFEPWGQAQVAEFRRQIAAEVARASLTVRNVDSD
jgi:hypothetical protein